MFQAKSWYEIDEYFMNNEISIKIKDINKNTQVANNKNANMPFLNWKRSLFVKIYSSLHTQKSQINRYFHYAKLNILQIYKISNQIFNSISSTKLSQSA